MWQWPRDEQLAWAAGLFDGEGTTSVSGPWDTPQVTVPQSGSALPEVLVRYQLIVGCGSVLGPELARERRPRWTVQSSGPKAIRVLEALWPYLGPIKRQQAHAALEKYRRHPTPSRRIAALTGRPHIRRLGRTRGVIGP